MGAMTITSGVQKWILIMSCVKFLSLAKLVSENDDVILHFFSIKEIRNDNKTMLIYPLPALFVAYIQKNGKINVHMINSSDATEYHFMLENFKCHVKNDHLSKLHILHDAFVEYL